MNETDPYKEIFELWEQNYSPESEAEFKKEEDLAEAHSEEE